MPWSASSHAYTSSLLSLGTHCLLEWQEEGNPRNIVSRKCVTGELEVGKVCEVLIREGNKNVKYSAKLLGVGKFLW